MAASGASSRAAFLTTLAIHLTTLVTSHRHDFLRSSDHRSVVNISQENGGSFPGSECGYNKEDMYESTETSLEFTDPRAHAANFGYRRGFASKFLRIGRAIVGKRVVALELSGKDAETAVLAQYGIISASVPKECWSRLWDQLNNEGKSWQEITNRKAGLRRILEEELPFGCEEGPEEEGIRKLPGPSAEGKAAGKLLKALRYGHWTSYEPLMSEKDSVISVRVLDKLRWTNAGEIWHTKSDGLRQIWHYSRIHLLNNIQISLTDSIINAPKSEKARVSNQLRRLYRLTSMRNARLEFVTLDASRNCKSAQPHEVMDLVDAIRSHQSAQFRTTLMFREKFWTRFLNAPVKFVRHPLSHMHKFGTRQKDEWSRTAWDNKLAMILRPLAIVASIVGVVLGVATAGQSTLGMLVAQLIVGEAYGALAAFLAVEQATLISFVVGRLIQEPLSFIGTNSYNEYLSSVCASESWLKITNTLEKAEVLVETNSRINELVEQIMSRNDVVLQMQAAIGGDPDKLGDYEDIEEEVRRYVDSLVRGSVIDEMMPVIQELIQKQQAQTDVNFGWLHWDKWAAFRANVTATSEIKALEHLRVRGPGISGVQEVSAIDPKGWLGGPAKLMLTENAEKDSLDVHSDYSSQGQTDLTENLKKGLYVQDFVAYKRLHSGWLLWHDWTEYRQTGKGKELKDKMIYFDLDLEGCAELEKQRPCLRSLAKSSDISGTFGSQVTKTTWKTLGRGNRHIFTTSQACEQTGFELAAPVKACLRVLDADAYAKYASDTLRREEEEAFNSGDMSVHNEGDMVTEIPLSIEPDTLMAIADEISNKVRCSSSVELGDRILEDRLGGPSVAFGMQDPLGASATNPDEDTDNVGTEDGGSQQEAREDMAAESSPEDDKGMADENRVVLQEVNAGFREGGECARQ